jgi:glycosyltransferase involved in cell wall biosynthesis
VLAGRSHTAPPRERKLRVLQLVAKLGAVGGGAERVAREIALGLDPSRFEPFLCVSRVQPRNDRAGDVARVLETLAAGGVRYLGLARRRRYDLWRWHPFISFLRRERVDVIHAHQYPSNFWATVLGRLAGVPVVVAHEHSWSFEGRPVRRFLDREVIARGSSVMIAVCEEDRRRLIEVEGVDPRHVIVVHNGIVGRQPTPDRDVRAELGIPRDAPVIGTVSGLRPEKGIGVLLQAGKILARRHPGLKLLVAGEGNRELLASAGPSTLDEFVVPLGFRADVPEVVAAFDVAVCASFREGSPLSIMEYMEAGVPTVSTRVGGVPELIQDGVHGLLVPAGAPDRLADAVTSLLRDPREAARMGRRARERRRREFDLAAVIHRLEGLYERLYAERDRSRDT